MLNSRGFGAQFKEMQDGHRRMRKIFKWVFIAAASFIVLSIIAQIALVYFAADWAIDTGILGKISTLFSNLLDNAVEATSK